MSLERGSVVAVRAWGVVVRMATGETILARNGLGVRTPPGARVLISKDHVGRLEIVSRPR